MKFVILSALFALGIQAYAEPLGTDMAHSSEGMPVHNDAQIVAIVKTANDIDIRGGKFAEKKAQRADVKSFAKEMVKDHTESNQKLRKLIAKTHLASTQNDTTRGMKTIAKDTEGHLNSVTASEFDHEYIQSELAIHQEVLTDLDNDLIPHSQNMDLKKLLNEVRGVVANHLQKAKNIETAMSIKK